MKQNKLLFLLAITIALFSISFDSSAMELSMHSLTPEGGSISNDPTAQQTVVGPDAEYYSDYDLKYPGPVSFLLGYSRTNISNGKMSGLSVLYDPSAPIYNFQTQSAGLNGITLGINQFITYHFGYEFNFNYYLNSNLKTSYTGTYADGVPPNIVTANGSVKNTLLTTELLGMLGLHMTKQILFIVKAGVGYEHFQQLTHIDASFTDTTNTYVPYDTTVKENKFGVAGAAGLRFDLNENFSLTLDANDLHAKKNIVAYQAGLLMRL